MRRRYLLLSACAVGCFLLRYETKTRGLSDWLWFEFGARTIVHFNAHYDTGSLQVYAHYPVLQIGPPPLLIVAALQWLPPAMVAFLLGLTMALAGVLCVRFAETVARVGSPACDTSVDVIGRTVLLAGGLATALWAWDVAAWMHLDDVIAITLSLAAMAAISRARPWWLAPILVGLAVASKPWAVVMTPVLLGLPRTDRARGFLVMAAAVAGPWLPFILGDRHTVGALDGFTITVDPRAAMHVLGLPLGIAPHWTRPLQLLTGIALASWAALRGRWMAIPLLAFGLRVVTDPQSWGYYGLGPLMGAVLWDLATMQRHVASSSSTGFARWWRDVPVWTVATALVEFGVRAVEPRWAGGVELIWFAGVLAAVVSTPPASLLETPPAGPARDAQVSWRGQLTGLRGR